MADDIKPEENIGDVPQSPVVIHTQYLKDLSFENPNAPEVLRKGNQPPEMDMNITMDVQRLESDEIEYLYEVVLTVSASAVREGKTLFIGEITYGAAVSINGTEETKHHPFLFVEVPYMLFPFVRHILSNATQAGGYTPLRLAPVDFRAMYLERFANKDKKEATK